MRGEAKPVGPRLDRRIDRSGGPAACWPCAGAASDRGYPIISVHNRLRRVSRVLLEEKLGRPLAPGEQALHTCDFPPCCNPAHLFVGTQADNVHDMVAKGRHRGVPPLQLGPRGIRQRLSDDEVAAIREGYAGGMSQQRLAQLFGVNQTYVSQLVRGEARFNAGGPITTEPTARFRVVA